MRNLARKSLAVFMCMLLCMIGIPFGAVTVSAGTATTGKLGDLSYSITGGKVTITDCVKTATTVEIPSKIAGYPVTSIGEYAFDICKGLTSVSIPNSVTNIERYAFSDCESLILMIIPNSVASIEESAFSYCNNLTSIIVDTNNKNYYDIDGVLFNKNNTGLVQYPIAKTATSYSVPNSVTNVGNWAFSYCKSLISVTIPNSVTNIGNDAFSSCISLTSIIVDRNNLNYCDIDGVLFNKDKTSMIKYPEKKIGESYSIPDSVTSIGEDAFSNCNNLTSIIIPDSVTMTQQFTFCDCNSLTSITVDKGNLNYCDVDGVLFNKDKTLLIKYPEKKISKNYLIPNSVKDIEFDAFSSCTNLTSVIIPNSVITIENFAFWNCTNLTSITIPNSVTSIGDSAFRNCNRLTSITIPNSITSISDCTFWDCTSLTSVIIPDSVTTIEMDAFMNCYKLTSITIPDSVTTIGNGAFGYYYDSSLKLINGCTIYGYAGSTAETYAKNNKITFKSVGTSTTTKGDVDGNNKVDAVDAALTLKYFTLSMTGKTITGTFDKSVADVDASGKIDAVDAAHILKYFTKNMSHSFTWSDIIGK